MAFTHPFITVVSGYQRSGTSLMMQMLDAGGLPVLQDKTLFPADEGNLRGYYEIQAALSLGVEGQATDWIAGAQGQAVKVFAYQLRFLPTAFNYRIIFMCRRIDEVLASSRKFNLLREDSPLQEREKTLAFKAEYVVYEAWFMKQPHMSVIFVNYNDLMDCPAAPIARICEFLGLPLNKERMIAAIDPALYHNRSKG